jgi:AcrR family transcriptional regulator
MTNRKSGRVTKQARSRTRTDHRTLPRPGGRTARNTAAVLDAAFRLLVAKGLENMSIADVAAASQVHETTIYRRWKTVNALALDACLRSVSVAVPVPDRGSLRADLAALVRSIIRLLEEPAGKALLDICRINDPQVGEARAAFFAERFAAVDVLFDRAVDRGEWNERFDRGRLLELLIAPIYLRALVTQGSLRSWPVAEVVGTLLNGVHARE